jgi:hypothetical protein
MVVGRDGVGWGGGVGWGDGGGVRRWDRDVVGATYFKNGSTNVALNLSEDSMALHGCTCTAGVIDTTLMRP